MNYKDLIIRGVFLNDKNRIEDIIKRNFHEYSLLSTNVEYDINSIISQNISQMSPNKTYCILNDTLILGFIHFYGFNVVDNSIFMGYMLDNEYRGYGIMAHSCNIVLKHMLSKSINVVYIFSESSNDSSIKLAQKLGFIFLEHVKFNKRHFNKYILDKSSY